MSKWKFWEKKLKGQEAVDKMDEVRKTIHEVPKPLTEEERLEIQTLTCLNQVIDKIKQVHFDPNIQNLLKQLGKQLYCSMDDPYILTPAKISLANWTYSLHITQTNIEIYLTFVTALRGVTISLYDSNELKRSSMIQEYLLKPVTKEGTLLIENVYNYIVSNLEKEIKNNMERNKRHEEWRLKKNKELADQACKLADRLGE